MLRPLFILSGLVALVSAAHAAVTFPGGPRYDGTIKIVTLTGPSCPPGLVGQVFTTAYRAKFTSNQIREAMSLSIPTYAGGAYIEANGDGTFKGTDQEVDGTYILDAFRHVIPPGVVNLTYRPNTVTETTTEFTFRGTYVNFLVPSCTADIRGSFIKR
jgi:hypothetical protein